MDKSEENTNKLEELRDILENFTEYVESHSDYVHNYVMAEDVLEYINDMWKVFGENKES